MIVCSWNINSVRMRESLLLELIDSLDPDVIFLQEIKCQDNEFPSVDKKNEYSLVINGEKGKYGVAILIKKNSNFKKLILILVFFKVKLEFVVSKLKIN